MKLLEFGFKNIFSYGNKLQNIKIKQDEANLVLILGPKGQGKSSIKEAIILSIYGKSPFRKIKKVPNRINKNSYLYNKYITNTGQIVETERGLEPNFMKLTVDGVSDKFSNADKKKLDSIIEDKLVKIPFNVFCNTVTISVNDFKSFVSLSPEDKRKIIDRIFGLEDINSMNDLNKKAIKTLNEEISVLDQVINRNTDLLNSTNSQLIELQKQIDENSTTEILILTEEIRELERDKELEKEKYQVVTELIKKNRSEIDLCKEKIQKNGSGLIEIQKKLDLYAKGKCPHCLSDLTDDKHANINGKLLDLKKAQQQKAPKLSTELQALQSQHSVHEKRESELRDSFYEFDSKIKIKKIRIKDLTTKLNSTDETSKITSIIEEIQRKIDESDISRSKLKEKLIINLELGQAFAVDGMKSLLMAQIVPMINQKIIERSSEIDFPFAFEFNDQFEPLISQLGQEVELEELSTGEQKEMNLITLFCILDLILMKTNLNFLFLDEIYTSLDKDSIYRIVSLLRKFVDQYKITIFTISHDPLPDEFFDSKIHISKDKYFSDMIMT